MRFLKVDRAGGFFLMEDLADNERLKCDGDCSGQRTLPKSVLNYEILA
jgi:hypothetical protein